MWYALRAEHRFQLKPVLSNSTLFHCNHYNFMSSKPVDYQRSTVYANYGSSYTGCPGKSNSSRPCATITSVQKSHLRDCKLSQYNSDPLQWHDLFRQFKSAIDSATLTDDVNLTYLKMLVTGKAKRTIAEFAYSGTVYQVVLQTRERKFGETHAVLIVCLDELKDLSALKMHKSESINSYFAKNSAVNVGASITSLRPRFKECNFSKPSSTETAAQLAGRLSHAHSKNKCSCPTLLEFNDWLKEKAEALERMKATSGKPRVDEILHAATKTKSVSKVFASASKADALTVGKIVFPTKLVTLFSDALVSWEDIKEESDSRR